MSKEIAIKEKDAKKLLGEAKECFRKMQESWFYFGKSVHAIYYGKVYCALEEGLSFKDYCEREFNSISYGNIMKMIAVVEQHGVAIETRIKKDAQYRIPSYDDCYQAVIAANREGVPRDEVTKLRKEILDGRIFYKEIRERVRELIAEYTKKTKEEVEASAREIERKLTKDLEEENLDEFSEEDFDGDGDEDEIDSEEVDDIEEDGDTDLKSAIAATKARVDYLNDNLRDLLKRVEADGESDEAAELCEALDKLYSNIDKFLDKYEDLTK